MPNHIEKEIERERHNAAVRTLNLHCERSHIELYK